MYTPTKIKYRPDGSIDTDHYVRLGCKARSEAAHEMAKRLVSSPKPTRRFFGLGCPRLLRLG